MYRRDLLAALSLSLAPVGGGCLQSIPGSRSLGDDQMSTRPPEEPPYREIFPEYILGDREIDRVIDYDLDAHPAEPVRFMPGTRVLTAGEELHVDFEHPGEVPIETAGSGQWALLKWEGDSWASRGPRIWGGGVPKVRSREHMDLQAPRRIE